MELLLNLIWLMLALPAALIWRGHIQSERKNVGTTAALILVACVLLLLFPIVSASDDLHAMRSEIEESCPSKRLAKQAVCHRSNAPEFGAGDLQLQNAFLLTQPQFHVSEMLDVLSVGDSDQSLVKRCRGRSPPLPELS